MSDMFSFLGGDDGSDSGGDIGSTIFDPGSVDLSSLDLSSLDLSQLASGFEGDIGNLGITPDFLQQLSDSPELLRAFQAEFPEDFARIKDILYAGGDYGFAPVGGGSPESAALLSSGNLTKTGTLALTGEGIIADAAQDAIAEELGQDATKIGSLTQDSADSALVNPADINKNVKVTQAPISEKVKKTIADVLGLDDKTISDLGKYGLLAGIAKLAYDDAEKARKAKLGYIAPGGSAKRAVISPGGSVSYTKAASGGIMSLAGGGFTGTDEDYRNAYKPPAPDYGPPPPVTASPIANIGPGMYYSLQEPRPNLSYSEYLKALAKDPAFIKFKEDNPHAAAEFENMHPAVENRTFNPAKAFEPFYTREQISPDQKFDAATQTFFTPRKNWAGTKIDEYGRAGQEKQLENVYRQLDAMDQWNTTQAANAGRELLPAERMMAVGIKDDYNTSGPAVILHDPSRGRFIPAAETGKFMRGDPSASYEQAKNILPYEQAAAILGITNPFPSEKENEQILDYIEKKGVPSLLFTEYDRGTFLPSAYGLSPRLAAKREYELTNKVKPLDFLKKYLNLTPYQGPMPTIYQFPELTGYAEGGMTDKQPFYLGGITDGMADEVPAHIDNKRPAALSDGEFVIPADVVSHLGNGNSNAGAKRLYEMMDNIRQARTGNKDQGVQINPNKFMLG